jgi:hypothetical protein
MLTTVLLLICSMGSLGASNECPSNWRPPEVHGVRLGMSVKQVKSKLPFLKFPRRSALDTKYDVRWSFLPSLSNPKQRKRMAQVLSLEIWFWKNRVVRYNVQYFGSTMPKGLAQFINSVETRFNLSETKRIAAHGYQCGSVVVLVADTLKRTISLRDAEGDKILNKLVSESYGLKP